MVMFLSALSTILSLKEDVNGYKNLHHFKKGDKVKYNGSIGLIENITDDETITLIFKGKTIISFPFDKNWQKLFPYEGNAKVTNYSYRPIKRVEKSKSLFSELLEIDEEKINLIDKSKIVVVCDKKNIDYYKNLKIMEHNFFNIFESGYFKDGSSFDRLSHDPLQRVPSFCFVSSLSVVNEMIKSGYKINQVIIFGMRKVEGNYYFIEQIRDAGISVFISGDYLEINSENLKMLENFEFGINIMQLNRENIKDVPTHFIDEQYRSINNKFKKISLIKQQLANYKCDRVIVESEVDKQLRELKRELFKLKDYEFDSNEKDLFIKKSFTILNHLKNLPAPIITQEQVINDFSIKATIGGLEELRMTLLFQFHSDEFVSFITKFIEKINKLVFDHYHSHPKQRYIINIAQKFNNNDCLVVDKKGHVKVVKYMLDQLGLKKDINVLTLKEFTKQDNLYNLVCFAGLFDQNQIRIRRRGQIKTEKVVLYKYEEEMMTYYIQNEERLIQKYKPSENVQLLIDSPTLSSNIDGSFLPFMSNLLRLEHFIKSNEIDLIKHELSTQSGQDNVVKVKIVIFYEGYVAYLTDGFNCRVLDNDAENLQKKKINHLEIDDELIFVDSNNDIFELLINQYKSSSHERRELYYVSGLWRDALKDYVDKNNFSYTGIKNELKSLGVVRSIETIKYWLENEETIGPENAVIEAVAKITNHYELKNRLSEVINACSRVRSIHVQLGRYLAQTIITRTLNKDGENSDLYSDYLIKDVTDSLSKKALVVTVNQISDEYVNVPFSKANKLIEN